MRTRFNWTNFKRHLTYNGWKYILAAVLIGFGIDMLFTTTRYIVPNDKKIEIYIYGYANDETLEQYMIETGKEETPDMEEMSCQVIMPDDQQADMVLQVRLMAQEGDIYIVPRDRFFSCSSVGFFAELDSYPEIMELIEEKDIKTDTGWRTLEEQTERHLYGIPVSQLPSLGYFAYVEDGYVCLYVGSGEDGDTIRFLKRFLTDMSVPVSEPEAEETTESTVTAGENE